ERARLFEAIVELLEWASDERPLVLLLEDVHVADAASLELAAYAGRRLGGLPVLMIVTRRDLPRPPEVDSLEHTLRARGVLRLELIGLPHAASEALQSGLLVAREGRIGYRHALLRESVYHELPDPERAWLHERLAAALDDPAAPERAAEVARHLQLAHRDSAAA